jgi:hypothetical protein
MNIRPFAIIFVCAAAPAIAFPLGIRVGSSWGAKSGPELHQSADGRPIAAPPQPVRVILPNTLDGQPIPGEKVQAAAAPRAFSPVFPTSASPEMGISASRGLAPASDKDKEKVEPTPAQPKPEGGAADLPQASSPIAQAEPAADEPSAGITKRNAAIPLFYFSGRRHSGHYGRHRHYRYFAHRRGRPSNPFSALAGLFFR